MKVPKIWKVLILDDSSDSIIALKRATQDCFSKFGLKVEIGIEYSLFYGNDTAQNWQPNIILLDIHMPPQAWRPDKKLLEKYPEWRDAAFAFCETITSDPRFSHTLVITITEDPQAEIEAKALAAGSHMHRLKDIVGNESSRTTFFKEILSNAARLINEEDNSDASLA